MGGVAVAGLTGYFRCQIVFYEAFPVGKRRVGVYPSGNIVKTCGMAPGTVKILAVRSHMNVKVFVWFSQGSIQVTVFNTITTPAVEMAGTAVFAGGKPDTLNRLLYFGADFPGQFFKLRVIIVNKSVHVFKGFFPVDLFLTMADQAVNGLGLVSPAGMAGHASFILLIIG